MKKIYETKFGRMFTKMGFAVVLTASSSLGLQAQGVRGGAEAYPNYAGPSNEPWVQPDQLWDVQLDINATAGAGGSTGQAGVVYIKAPGVLANGEFWTSKWASDTIIQWSSSGSMMQKFTIPGLTGVRSMTWDGGTYLYAANNTDQIYRIDPINYTLAPPHITVDAPLAPVRHISYSALMDGGNGGFYTGNFATDITGVNMNGNNIGGLPASIHGLSGMYGSGWDPWTDGGAQYVWIFNQGGANTTQIERIETNTSQTTSLASHDVFPDFASTNGLTSGLAGGMFTTDQFVTGRKTIGGMIQGTPNNVLFAYDLTSLAARFEEALTGVQVYPNPSKGAFAVRLIDKADADVTITVTNLMGQVVRSYKANPSVQQVTDVDLSDEAQGVYMVRVQSGEQSTLRKVVVAH